MKRNKKKLKKIITNIVLCISFGGMWTSMMIFGFMTATTLN